MYRQIGDIEIDSGDAVRGPRFETSEPAQSSDALSLFAMLSHLPVEDLVGQTNESEQCIEQRN